MGTLNAESIGMNNVNFLNSFSSGRVSRPNTYILPVKVFIEKLPILKQEIKEH